MGRRLLLATGTLMATLCVAPVVPAQPANALGWPTYADAVVAADGTGLDREDTRLG